MGDVTHIESRIDGSRGIPGDWRRDPSRGGGMVLDWGVHLVDRLLLMVPAPVRTVYARLSYTMGAPVEDGFMIYLTFAGGVEAVAACTTDNYAPGPKFHVKGTRGTAIVGTATKAVTNESVVRCMRVLEAARKSHETNTVIDLSGSDTYIDH